MEFQCFQFFVGIRHYNLHLHILHIFQLFLNIMHQFLAK